MQNGQVRVKKVLFHMHNVVFLLINGVVANKIYITYVNLEHSMKGYSLYLSYLFSWSFTC